MEEEGVFKSQDRRTPDASLPHPARMFPHDLYLAIPAGILLLQRKADGVFGSLSSVAFSFRV